MASIRLAFTHQAKNWERTIERFPAVLGRGPKDCKPAEFRVALDELEDPCMSRIHARLHWNNNRCWIEDADSLLGTRLNGRKLPLHTLHVLSPGDELLLGQTAGFVRLSTEPHAAGAAPAYHVFLSHSTSDKPLVERIAQELAEFGLASFLDKNDIHPGDVWQSRLEDALNSTPVVAFCAGHAASGPWARVEALGAFQNMIGGPAGKMTVIPVILENCPAEPQWPSFLNLLHHVDFRQDRKEALHRLAAAIRGRCRAAGVP